MPGLLDTCEELFQTKDLYQVFGIEKSANASQIKKAYHKVILANNIWSSGNISIKINYNPTHSNRVLS